MPEGLTDVMVEGGTGAAVEGWTGLGAGVVGGWAGTAVLWAGTWSLVSTGWGFTTTGTTPAGAEGVCAGWAGCLGWQSTQPGMGVGVAAGVMGTTVAGCEVTTSSPSVQPDWPLVQ